MKRVLFPCLEQSVHFQLKEEVEHAAVRAINKELEIFKRKL